MHVCANMRFSKNFFCRFESVGKPIRNWKIQLKIPFWGWIIDLSKIKNEKWRFSRKIGGGAGGVPPTFSIDTCPTYNLVYAFSWDPLIFWVFCEILVFQKNGMHPKCSIWGKNFFFKNLHFYRYNHVIKYWIGQCTSLIA